MLCLAMIITAAILLLAGFPAAFTLAGTSMLFAFAGAALGVFEPALLAAFPQRIFSVMSNQVLIAVPLFIFMGAMLERSKIAADLLEDIARAMSAVPGGLAIAVSLVGMLLAASTGIAGATVVTMGLVSLPVMLRHGYGAPFACGSIAAAGTLGQIIPPSIVLVLLGDQLSAAYQNAQYSAGIAAPETVGVNDLFAGALLPGLMLVAFYILYQMIYARLGPAHAPPVSGSGGRDDDPGGGGYRRLAASAFAPLLLIVAVLGSILGGLASPGEAASVGALGALMLAGHRVSPSNGGLIRAGGGALVVVLVLAALFDLRMAGVDVTAADRVAQGIAVLACVLLAAGIWAAIRNTWRHIADDGVALLTGVGRSTMTISSMVFVIVIGASMFSLVFRGFNGDLYIERVLADLPGGTAGAVLLVMAVIFIMGFFLDFLEIMFIVVPVVAPVLLRMEVAPGELMSPVWLGVMIALNLQTSFLTPPFGFSLFYLRGVAPDEVRTLDIYKGVGPFVVLQLLGLAALWQWPQIATWLPVMLYGG